MFQSNTGPSFVAHQYMIAGQSAKASENPSGSVWGCDAEPDERGAAGGAERDRPSRRLSLLRLLDHGRPARRQGHHLALLCARPNHRLVLHPLGLPGDPAYPLQLGLDQRRHLARDPGAHRHRPRRAGAGDLDRAGVQQLRPSRRAARRARTGWPAS